MTPPTMPQPKNTPSSDAPRLWLVFIWALAVSSGIGAGYWAYGYFHDQAARQAILLVPDQPVDEQHRSELALKLGTEPGVASATWIAPADQAQRLQAQFPDERWKEAYPADVNWLPWVLEVKPADPLGNRDLVTAFVAKRQQEGGWQVYWDGSTLDQLSGQARTASAILIAWIAVLFTAGCAALTRMPKPAHGVLCAAATAAAVAIVPAAMWVALHMLDMTQENETFFASGISGSALAFCIAPMLGLRRTPDKPAASTFSTTVEEAPDERVR